MIIWEKLNWPTSECCFSVSRSRQHLENNNETTQDDIQHISLLLLINLSLSHSEGKKTQKSQNTVCELYVQPEQLPSSLLQFHNKTHPQFTGRIQSGVQLTEDFICKHCTETEPRPRVYHRRGSNETWLQEDMLASVKGVRIHFYSALK